MTGGLRLAQIRAQCESLFRCANVRVSRKLISALEHSQYISVLGRITFVTLGDIGIRSFVLWSSRLIFEILDPTF